MNIAILRVEGPAELLSELKKLLVLSTDVEWFAGEKKRDGSIRDLSGFNATIADSESMTSVVSQLRDFLAQCAATDVTFPWHGINGEVDIGFSVGDAYRFAGGFRMSPEDIQAFAKCGLGLVTTAYPTSDEVNAT